MCGICGKINFENKAVDRELLRTMCNSLSDRGPDYCGIFTNTETQGHHPSVHVGLGHQRLSIIDLSAAGRQPMSNEDQSIWITFNGELYNYLQIKKDLQAKGHTFKSNTDTEVLVHLYEEEGLNAVNHLNGMFAFALWDERLSRLWIARDRIGIKPLVYYLDGKQFIFASEIKSLLKDPIISKELDYKALFLYLAFNYIPAPHTIFKTIKKIEPGHHLVLENGNLSKKQYWDAPRTLDPEISSLPFHVQEEFYKHHLYNSLSSAVNDRLISDVPLGAFLSGGIDSSIIVALMACHSDKPVKTFSIGYTDDKLYDETGYAREIAAL